MQKYKYLVDRSNDRIKNQVIWEISKFQQPYPNRVSLYIFCISFAWLKPIHEVNGPAGVDYGNNKKGSWFESCLRVIFFP